MQSVLLVLSMLVIDTNDTILNEVDPTLSLVGTRYTGGHQHSDGYNSMHCTSK